MIKETIIGGLAAMVLACNPSSELTSPRYEHTPVFNPTPAATYTPVPTATATPKPTATTEPWYTVTSIPEPTIELILTKVPEPTKELLTVSFMSDGSVKLIGLVYDTDGNGFPDLYEIYAADIDAQGVIYIIECEICGIPLIKSDGN